MHIPGTVTEETANTAQKPIKQTINAAILNISGRQRMLSQRAAMLCLWLASSQQSAECKRLRQELNDVAILMQQSHQGLIKGDVKLGLPGGCSNAIHALYFESPFQVDKQVNTFIQALLDIAKTENSALTVEHPQLKLVLGKAHSELLTALDAVVKQYQQESDLEQQLMASYQAQLFEQRSQAATQAQAQAKELKKTLNKLHQTQEQLIQAAKMNSLGQLVGGIAHEINNPINFIYGNIPHAVEHLRDLMAVLNLYQENSSESDSDLKKKIGKFEPEFLVRDFHEILSSMSNGADRIREIVLQLKNFSRHDESEFKNADIHEGLESTLVLLQCRLGQNENNQSIQIIKEYGELPHIDCYASSLNQVFMDILSNAIDAFEFSNESKDSPPTAPQITIRTRQIQDRLQIEIHNNGPIIPESIQARIFDPFFTTKPVGKGTGMGLSISYRTITEKHDGQLTCQSTPGTGTTFTICLPLSFNVDQPSSI